MRSVTLSIPSKRKCDQKLQVMISKESRTLLKAYAKSRGYSDNELNIVLDMILAQIKFDPDFQRWLARQRYGKRLRALLGMSGPLQPDLAPEQEATGSA